MEGEQAPALQDRGLASSQKLSKREEAAPDVGHERYDSQKAEEEPSWQKELCRKEDASTSSPAQACEGVHLFLGPAKRVPGEGHGGIVRLEGDERHLLPIVSAPHDRLQHLVGTVLDRAGDGGVREGIPQVIPHPVLRRALRELGDDALPNLRVGDLGSCKFLGRENADEAELRRRWPAGSASAGRLMH